jgi:hypothetical protein
MLARHQPEEEDMGKTTRMAESLVQQLAQSRGGNEHTDNIFGQRIDTSYVYGVLIVKDWKNNIHNQVAIPSTYDSHAENEMLTWLVRTYGQGFPFSAKIIFYVSKSPCRRCTQDSGIPDRLLGAYQQLAQQHPFYVSIVFHTYYLGEGASTFSNRDLSAAWGNPSEADCAYRAAEKLVDRWSAEAGLGVNGILNIRHLAQTKASAGEYQGSRLKIPFAYGIR